MIDWQGKPYDKATAKTPAAHPNSRFTVSAKQNPAYSHLMEHPEGVPISAILFGGRRREVAPLVYEARDWAHGVMIGAGAKGGVYGGLLARTGCDVTLLDVRADHVAAIERGETVLGYDLQGYWSDIGTPERYTQAEHDARSGRIRLEERSPRSTSH